MSEKSSPAWIVEVHAYRLRDRLWFVGTAKVSSGCHVAFVEQSPLLIFPPQFSLSQQRDAPPGQLCTDALTIRPIGAKPASPPGPTLFHYPKDEKSVVLRDLGGAHAVEIKNVRIPPNVAAFDGGGDLPTPFLKGLSETVQKNFEVVQAIGYSASYSLGEAIQDAMMHLATRPSSEPDVLDYFAVVSIGAEVGGFAGFNRLRVVIQTLVPRNSADPAGKAK